MPHAEYRAEDPDPFGTVGLTYDDVMLLPGHTDVLPSEADTGALLTRRIALKVPLVSAAMDTVTGDTMAIAMARFGGLGIIHRNLSIADQAAMVARVKHADDPVRTPATPTADATITSVAVTRFARP